MKPIYEKFYCPQCGQIRYVYIDGVCSSCKTLNELEKIIHLKSKNAIISI